MVLPEKETKEKEKAAEGSISPSQTVGSKDQDHEEQLGPKTWSQSVLQNVDLLQNDGAVVESIFRTSERQKDLNKDFKKSACSVKGCLGCTMDPQLFPFLSSEI